MALLWLLASSPLLDRWLKGLIGWALDRWTGLDTRDYVNLLHLSGEYQVQELKVQQEDWLADRSLGQLNLRDEGVLVLGIQRSDGRYVGAPGGDTGVQAGDVLLLYGREGTLKKLDDRRSGFQGDREHDESVAEQRNVERQEKAEDEQAEAARRSRGQTSGVASSR